MGLWKFIEQRIAYQEVQAKSGAVRRQQWTAPAAADNTSLHAAITLNAAAATIAATDRVFVITSGNATAGATYTNNGQTFTVKYTISSKTQLICSATGASAASGTLTKASGTGDSTITFSAARTFAQPDFPRAIRLKASAVGDNSLVVTYNGTDMRDQAISEAVTITAYGTAQDTLGAFKTITSIVVPAESGASNISFGAGLALGLDRLLSAATVFVATVDGAVDSALPTQATSTSAISSNNVIMATAPNASHNFLVCFVTTELTEASGSTA